MKEGYLIEVHCTSCWTTVTGAPYFETIEEARKWGEWNYKRPEGTIWRIKGVKKLPVKHIKTYAEWYAETPEGKNPMQDYKEKIVSEMREKFGRFYYSDKIGMDWLKPEKIGTKTGIMCLPSDEIEDFILSKYEQGRADGYEKGQDDAFRGKIEGLKTLEIKETIHIPQVIKDKFLSDYKKGLLQNLPEERIIHGYMKNQDEGKTNEYCDGWNDFRNRAINLIQK